MCKNYDDEIDCVFFNSYEGYIKKILPLEKEIILTGDKFGARTSNQYFIDKKETIDNKINNFTAKVLKLPIENQELTSIVRYTKGQEYKAGNYRKYKKETKEK